MNYLHLEPVKQSDIEPLAKSAAADNHGVYVPTHLVVREGKTLGYFSIGSPGVPVVLGWLNTKDVPARESFHLIDTIQQAVRMNGALGVSFPVPKASPFWPIMSKLGFKDGGNYDFWYKTF